MTENKRFQAMIDTDMQSIGLFDDLKDKHYFSFDEVVDLLNELYEENQKLKEDAKQVLFVLACCNRDFGLSVNEAKAIKRLNECVDGSYNINNIKEFLDD